MRCPDPEELARHADGSLPEETGEQIAAHVDGCAACREVLVTVIRGSVPEAEPPLVPLDETAEPKRGDLIGRYLVLDAMGLGGMGLVVSAHDNHLDRKVALKLVRPDLENSAGAERTRARLLREAQLMARVRHPSVVTVYDVGTLGKRIFIAMELVDGVTLRTWLSQAPRSQSEVLGVFLQAGEGLAAAHSAGVVHRDFKPDNVLVDKHGKAHVMDFGLAVSPSPRSEHAPAGTPAYMAPEQVFAQAIDARTDQYAFCLALAEALTSERNPHGFNNLPPPLTGLSRRLQVALRRGLSVEPSQRFPDMHGLLDAIRPRASRRAVFGGVAVAAGLVAAAIALRAPGAQECEQGPERLERTWGAERRVEVEAAFKATGLPFAEVAFRKASELMDRRSAEWRRSLERSCQSSVAPQARVWQQACLEERLAELQLFAELFRRPDALVVEHAAEAAAQLGRAEKCLEPGAPQMLPLPDNAGLKVSVAQVRLLLLKSEAQQRAGHFADALAAATQAVRLAQQSQYAPVLAEAWLAHVEPLRSEGKYVEARAALEEAATAAEAGRHSEAQLRVAIKHLRVTHSDSGEEADRWIRRAERILAQTPDEALGAELNSVVGVLRLAQRRPAEALRRTAAALAYFQAQGQEADALGEQHVAALALRAQGSADSVAALERALDGYRRVFGPSHPQTLHVGIHLVEALLDRGEAPRALGILEGQSSFDGSLTTSWQSLSHRLSGDALRALGRFEESRAAHEAAVALVGAGQGGAVGISTYLVQLAATEREMEQLDQAERRLSAAVRGPPALAPGSLPHLSAQLESAELASARGESWRAQELIDEVLQGLSKRLEDPGAPERVAALFSAVRIACAANDRSRAQRLGEELLTVCAPGTPNRARAGLLLRRAGARDAPVDAHRPLVEAGLFPLELLDAAEHVPCADLVQLQTMRLPPGASKRLSARCPRSAKESDREPPPREPK